MSLVGTSWRSEKKIVRRSACDDDRTLLMQIFVWRPSELDGLFLMCGDGVLDLWNLSYQFFHLLDNPMRLSMFD